MASLMVYSIGAMLLLAAFSLPSEARRCYQCVGLGGKVKGESPCVNYYWNTGVSDCPVGHDYCYIVLTTNYYSTVAVDRGCANTTRKAYCEGSSGQTFCYSWCNTDSCNVAAVTTPGFWAIFLPTIAFVILGWI